MRVLASLVGTISLAGCAPAAHPTDLFSKADAYERFMGRWSRQLAPQLVRFAGVRDGNAVLDVGSGTGVMAFAIHDALPTTHITGVDPSPGYVDYARRHATDARVHFEVGDAQRLDMTDATFDRTLALLVMNFIPDAPRALSEMVRVTRPGGVVAAAVWDYAEGMTMLPIFWDEAKALDPGIEPPDEAHMPLAHAGELAALWRRAGLVEVEDTPLTIVLHFASFDDYWQPFLLGQGPAGGYVATLTQPRRDALARRLRARLLGTESDHAIELPARVWAVRGTVPAR